MPHVHVIPRYKGDITDSRGGMRWIIDEKANYWDKQVQPPSPDEQIQFLFVAARA